MRLTPNIVDSSSGGDLTQNIEETVPASRVTSSRRSSVRVTKWVRRIHLYTGLLLLPWVIFFGFSGVLFNHAAWSESATVTNLGHEEMVRLYGWQPVDASQLANELLEALNEDAGEARYERIQTTSPVLEGGITFQGQAESGEVNVTLSPLTGRATVTQKKSKSEAKQPDFEGKSILLDSISEGKGKAISEKILETSGIIPLRELKRAERGGTELRFQMKTTEDRQIWNVVYNAATGKLSGRATNETGGFELGPVVGRMHKLHGYPENSGARWLWSAFADATGVTMVFWGLSGLVMWWQMKPTRVLGICGLSLAAVAALFVFGGTYNSIFFGPAQQKGGISRPVGQFGADSDRGGPDGRPKGPATSGGKGKTNPRNVEHGEATAPNN